MEKFFFVINNKIIDKDNDSSILKIPSNCKNKSRYLSNFTEKISNYVCKFREDYLNEILDKS